MEKEKLDNPAKRRMKEFIASLGISEREFCRKIGVSSAYVESIKKSVSPKVMQTIGIHYPELNPVWLLLGKGEMLLNTPKEENRKSDDLPPSAKLDSILEEIRNEKARLQEANYDLIEIVKKQQETIFELTQEIKKANARKVDDATCAAAV